MRIQCPHCGVRDEAEFTYRGDASVARPGGDAGVDAFHDYLYLRANSRGWQAEWWQHLGGCRAVFTLRRHTVTHEIEASNP